MRDINPDGSFPVKRAFVFADPTAYAAVSQDMGEFDLGNRIVNSPDVLFFQLDRFLRQRAHLLADDAFLVVGPGDATTFIDICLSDYLRLFFLKAEGWNCLHGTDLTASVAGKIAISKARDEQGRPESLNAGIKDCGLKRIGRAGAHAFRTADAFGHIQNVRIAFAHTRRPDEEVWLAFGQLITLDQGQCRDGPSNCKHALLFGQGRNPARERRKNRV